MHKLLIIDCVKEEIRPVNGRDVWYLRRDEMGAFVDRWFSPYRYSPLEIMVGSLPDSYGGGTDYKWFGCGQATKESKTLFHSSLLRPGTISMFDPTDGGDAA